MRPFAYLLVALACACGPTGNMTADAGVDACRDTGKTPENLVSNPGFECGAESPAEWSAIYGSATFPAEGRSGRAAKLVLRDAAGARLGYLLDVATATSAATYCARVWMRGTAPYMRVSLATPNQMFTSDEQVSTNWKQVPYVRATAKPGEKLTLTVAMQTWRSDDLNAKPGDVLFVDDVDAWQSSTGRCDER